VTPEAQLAEFVDAHLGRGGPTDAAVGAVVVGLADLSAAFLDAQEQRGQWGRILSKLRTGTELVKAGVERLRGEPGFEGLVTFAERQRAFAATMVDEVLRLQAGESTLA
jgi:hypothetical protein